jgi:hypothetical protein
MKALLAFVLVSLACGPSPTKVDDGLRSVVRDGGSAVVDAGLDAGVEPPVRLRDLELASFLVDRRTYLGDAGPLLFVISPGNLVARWRTRDGGWGIYALYRQVMRKVSPGPTRTGFTSV